MKLVAIISILFSFHILADDDFSSDAKKVINKSKREVGKASRVIQDKTCELLNGKLECAIQKVKHSFEDAKDKVEESLE